MAGNQSVVDLSEALVQQRAGEPRTPFRRVTVGQTPAAPGSEVTWRAIPRDSPIACDEYRRFGCSSAGRVPLTILADEGRRVIECLLATNNFPEFTGWL